MRIAKQDTARKLFSEIRARGSGVGGGLLSTVAHNDDDVRLFFQPWLAF